MSHTASREIDAAQQDNRRLLAEAMSAQHFKNYERERWHFTYVRLPKLPKAQDFVITGERGETPGPRPSPDPRTPSPASRTPSPSPPQPSLGPPTPPPDPPSLLSNPPM